MTNNPGASLPQKILISPALTPTKISGRQVHFLFSIRQVEDILKETPVYPVPFSPPHVEGIAKWRNHALPVISLEKRLGLDIRSPDAEFQKSTRLIAVRALDPGEKYIMLRVSDAIRMFSLPISYTPAPSVGWLSEDSLVKGVYEWDEGYLLVLQLKTEEVREVGSGK